MPPVGNLYPKGGKQTKRVENSGAAGWESLPKRRIFLIWVENPRPAYPAILKIPPEIVHFSIRVCCLHIERKLKKCQRKKEKQLKAIWGYLSPRIEYLKDIPKNIFDKGISAISYTEEFDKNPKDTLKHIIDKLNSEFNSILHEYDFN